MIEKTPSTTSPFPEQIKSLAADVRAHLKGPPIVFARLSMLEDIALRDCARSETVTIEKHPDTIIAKIVEDIRGRKGLSDEWDNIDVDVRNEIIAEWRTFFEGKTAERRL